MLSNAENNMEVVESQTREQQEMEVSMTFTLPQSLRTKLKMYAAQNHTSIKKVIIELLEERLQ